ncbi:L-gulonolactone oxidase 2 [Carex littledalei]|uniref:L-gulonolactone oxidase n=1 Tax=Carex littledalei TaxID=544730 RepID=A0A833RWL5_9POAL|nr:L-gulonolactone oxidase 2 [Carex littledalei]
MENSTLTKSIHLLLLGILLISFLPPSFASPPPSPVKCTTNSTTNCTVTNAYRTFPDRSTCHASRVVYPTSEQKLVEIVANATASKTKMKVVTRFSHSIPKLSCPGGSNGLIISTRNLDHVVNMDNTTMKITVESGVTMKELIEEAAKGNLVIPYVPYWWGLTIGGVLSTGAHGSSLKGKGSAVHEYVTEIRLVTPAPANQSYASVRVLKVGDLDLDATKVSLGVLGVISQVTLQLQPMFKRSLTYVTRNDSDLADQAISFGQQHEFADITWFPGQRKVVYRKDDRVSVNISGSGVFDYIGFRPTATLAIKVNRFTEDRLEANKNADGKCAYSELTASTLALLAYGLTNNGLIFTGYPVIGYQNKMEASGGCAFGSEDGLFTACPWDPRLEGSFFHQTTVSIPLNKVKEFILDMQKLRDLQPNALCGLELYGGVLMRYAKASSAYLGKESDVIDFDITYYRSHDPMTPRLYEDFMEEIEQMALFKYGGLPHWGKNRNLAFDGIIRRYNKSQSFLEVKDRYDPDRLFSSEWSDQILGLNGSVIVKKAGCALEGLCICSEDIHCAPDNGYYCRPGKVYEDARVCTDVNLSSENLKLIQGI